MVQFLVHYISPLRAGGEPLLAVVRGLTEEIGRTQTLAKGASTGKDEQLECGRALSAILSEVALYQTRRDGGCGVEECIDEGIRSYGHVVGDGSSSGGDGTRGDGSLRGSSDEDEGNANARDEGTAHAGGHVSDDDDDDDADDAGREGNTSSSSERESKRQPVLRRSVSCEVAQTTGVGRAQAREMLDLVGDNKDQALMLLEGAVPAPVIAASLTDLCLLPLLRTHHCRSLSNHIK
jgi:hypothetical protein